MNRTRHVMYELESSKFNIIEDLHANRVRDKNVSSEFRAVKFITDMGYVIYRYARCIKTSPTSFDEDWSIWRLVDSKLAETELSPYIKPVNIIDNMYEKAPLILEYGLPCWNHSTIPVTKVVVIYEKEEELMKKCDNPDEEFPSNKCDGCSYYGYDSDEGFAFCKFKLEENKEKEKA